MFLSAEMLVKQDFHLQLFRSKFAMAKGVVFVYEFDCDDRVGLMQGTGFADAAQRLAVGMHEKPLQTFWSAHTMHRRPVQSSSR